MTDAFRPSPEIAAIARRSLVAYGAKNAETRMDLCTDRVCIPLKALVGDHLLHRLGWQL